MKVEKKEAWRFFSAIILLLWMFLPYFILRRTFAFEITSFQKNSAFFIGAFLSMSKLYFWVHRFTNIQSYLRFIKVLGWSLLMVHMELLLRVAASELQWKFFGSGVEGPFVGNEQRLSVYGVLITSLLLSTLCDMDFKKNCQIVIAVTVVVTGFFIHEIDLITWGSLLLSVLLVLIVAGSVMFRERDYES